jgi:small multidrug resistance pump
MPISESNTSPEDAPMTAYYYLAIAICAEVIATVSMKAVKGFSTPLPLVLVIVGYSIAFWMLTLVVRSVPVGVAYAVWAGMGIVMVSVAALFIYGQKLDVPAMLGMALIVLGVVVIQLFSKTAGH